MLGSTYEILESIELMFNNESFETHTRKKCGLQTQKIDAGLNMKVVEYSIADCH
jgi:hypothetical protein